MANRLEIDAATDDDGTVRATWLLEEAGVLGVAEDDGAPMPLPAAAIPAAFTRYAKPLAVAMPARAADDQIIPVPGGAEVRAFRFRGWGDVEPTDYLVLEAPGAEPVAAPARLVGAALRAVARAAAAAAAARTRAIGGNGVQ